MCFYSVSTLRRHVRDSHSSESDSSLFDVLLSATAERKLSGRQGASNQTLYDVIVDATIQKMGGWKEVTPEDALRVSKERSVLDIHDDVSTMFKVGNSSFSSPRVLNVSHTGRTSLSSRPRWPLS